MAKAFKKFLPLLDRVLVERFTPEVKTKGGIMLPDNLKGKVYEGTVLAVGEGTRQENGSLIPPSVTVGEKVLLPEIGGTKIVIEDKEYHLYKNGDLLGKFES